MSDRVSRILDLIRPAVQSDGGDIELVEVTGAGVVRIRLHGACVGCPSSTMTLRMGIEQNLKHNIPEVTAVEAVD
ncbi:MAG: NifU family protein [Phycisphaeraceae bacterium]|nr:MAG: NifU family protein [Phycisphaeraceae bacterium]